MNIIKEKFKIGEEDFETTKIDTRIEIKSIGQSLFDSSKIKMDNNLPVSKHTHTRNSELNGGKN